MRGNFTRVPNALIKCASLSSVGFRLYCFLRSFKEAFPSYNHIGRTLGLGSKTTIAKALSELEVMHLVRRQSYGGLGRGSNRYELLPESTWQLSLGTESEPALVQKVDCNNTKIKNTKGVVVTVVGRNPQEPELTKENLPALLKSERHYLAEIQNHKHIFWRTYGEDAKEKFQEIHFGSAKNYQAFLKLKNDGE